MSAHAVAPTVAAAVPVVTPVQRPALQRTCDCGQHTGGGECEDCKKKKRMPLQRYASGGAASPVAPPLVHEVLRSSGQPLDFSTRAFMEPRFRQDFSQVRVHDDEQAAESARSVGAHAYTVGKHVVFGAGKYAPQSREGRHLLAHELTHVAQQRSSGEVIGEIPIGDFQGQAEQEASRAEKTGEDAPVRVDSASPARVQGSWDWDRAGWGTLIGAGVGVGAGLIALAAGAPGLALGLLLGSIVGGFLIGGLTGGKKGAQQQTAAQQPPLPAGCNPDQNKKVLSGMQRALSMAQATVAALRGVGTGTKAAGTSPTTAAKDALKQLYKSDKPEVVGYLRQRFEQIRDMITSLLQGAHPKPPAGDAQAVASVPALACHTKENDDTCNRGIAYVGDENPKTKKRESMVFCPQFFDRSDMRTDDARGGVIIHEVSHAILSGSKSIGDRAYSDARFFNDLTTEEALTNADSYRLFAMQVSGASVITGRLADLVEGCDSKQEAALEKAMALAQRWVGVAGKAAYDRRKEWLELDYWIKLRKKYLGGEAVALLDQAAKVYQTAAGPLGMFAEASCHPKADATCPPGQATATEPGKIMGGPAIQLCPGWLNEKDPVRQALLVLAELAGSAGVKDQNDRLNNAQFAKELFDDLGQAPTMKELLED